LELADVDTKIILP